MKAIDFRGTNIVFAKDQPEYLPLPALVHDDKVITCWEVTDEDLERIKKDRKIYLEIWTFKKPLQPVRLYTDLSEGIDLITE